MSDWSAEMTHSLMALEVSELICGLYSDITSLMLTSIVTKGFNVIGVKFS